MYLIDGAALLVVEAAVREHQLEVGQNLILRPAARFLNLLEDKFKTSWQKTCVTDPDPALDLNRCGSRTSLILYSA